VVVRSHWIHGPGDPESFFVVLEGDGIDFFQISGGGGACIAGERWIEERISVFVPAAPDPVGSLRVSLANGAIRIDL
jgi:hypothetical protein